MNKAKYAAEWRPALASMVAGSLIVSGLLLTNISWWWLMLAGVGIFGPGVLREIGWLRDMDEKQLLANYRASYYAYVSTGLLLVLMVAYLRTNDKPIEHPQDFATVVLATLCSTWFLSSLIANWGAQKAAFRFLITFGLGWFFFAIASNVGREWTGWAALLLHPLLTLPFFGLAWISTRWPRIAGGLLLASSAFFMHFFGLLRQDHISIINRAFIFVLFVGPLLASGIALLGACATEWVVDDSESLSKRKGTAITK